MNKITTAEVKMAQMAVSNLSDETRTYDITANVAYNILPSRQCKSFVPRLWISPST